MCDKFHKLRTEDYALLKILYDGAPREWWYVGYTVSQLAEMTELPRSTVAYRLDRVLVPRNLIAKESGHPAWYYGIKDNVLREEIIVAWKKCVSRLLNSGIL